jgi:hypothetical protein
MFVFPWTHPELKNIISCAVSNLILENFYSDFRDRCNKKNVKTVWESVVLAYLLEFIYCGR